MNEATKEGIERKYRRKSTFFSLGALSGILLGGSAVFYGADFMDNKNDNPNPFSNTQAVIKYQSIEKTLEEIQFEHAINKSPPTRRIYNDSIHG
ncbi:hypothetical protein HYX19_00075, partial [Candidatus Woesearchaeota archaeon]|nr:hypothetical protein [Candidatus Woesearchaeota archaeon]